MEISFEMDRRSNYGAQEHDLAKPYESALIHLKFRRRRCILDGEP
jgi:hypothetical protein